MGKVEFKKKWERYLFWRDVDTFTKDLDKLTDNTYTAEQVLKIIKHCSGKDLTVEHLKEIKV